MVTIRSPAGTWIARNGKVYIATSIGVSVTETLSGVFSEASASGSVQVSAAFKSMTVTPPETSYEKVDLLGKDTNDFQNQLLDEKPVGIATFTGTLLVDRNETIEDKVVSGTVTSPAGYTRYQVGKNSSNTVNIGVFNNTATGSNMVGYALFDAKITKWGDVRISDAAGHWEQDITGICLAKDFYVEFKD